MKKLLMLLFVVIIFFAGCAYDLVVRGTGGGVVYEGVIVNPTSDYTVKLIFIREGVSIKVNPEDGEVITFPSGEIKFSVVEYYNRKGVMVKRVKNITRYLWPERKHYWKGKFYWWKIIIDPPSIIDP